VHVLGDIEKVQPTKALKAFRENNISGGTETKHAISNNSKKLEKLKAFRLLEIGA
jgi:hypothetical protein